MLSCSSSNLPRSENDNSILDLTENKHPVIVIKRAYCSLCLTNLKNYFDDAGVQSILVYDRKENDKLKLSKYVSEWPIEYLFYYTDDIEILEEVEAFPFVVWQGKVIDYDSLFGKSANVIYDFGL